jgi:hypothetical protein
MNAFIYDTTTVHAADNSNAIVASTTYGSVYGNFSKNTVRKNDRESGIVNWHRGRPYPHEIFFNETGGLKKRAG